VYNLQFRIGIKPSLKSLIKLGILTAVKNIFNSLITFLLFLTLANTSSAQTKTNLDVFYSLADSLVHKINSELPVSNKEILLQLQLGNIYSVFNNNIKSDFMKAGRTIRDVPQDEINIPVIDVVIENATVDYGEVYKDGWFGSYFSIRNFSIKGNYLQSFSNTGRQDFNITFADTVNVDQITELENDNFPFTKSQIPSEPFLSGLAEPILAIGAAAAMVVLFFSVRSK
jgi:hypothetical protein